MKQLTIEQIQQVNGGTHGKLIKKAAEHIKNTAIGAAITEAASAALDAMSSGNGNKSCGGQMDRCGKRISQ